MISDLADKYSGLSSLSQPGKIVFVSIRKVCYFGRIMDAAMTLCVLGEKCQIVIKFMVSYRFSADY
jgi:hypothetical protein